MKILPSTHRHSVIYNTVDLNNMSTKSYRLLGSRASHGCIRLLVSDAKWIYDNVGEGVVVTVTEDLPDDEELRKAVAAPAAQLQQDGPRHHPPNPRPRRFMYPAQCRPSPLKSSRRARRARPCTGSSAASRSWATTAAPSPAATTAAPRKL